MPQKKRKPPKAKPQTTQKRRRAPAGRMSRVLYGVLVFLAVVAVAFFLFLRMGTGTSAAENALGTVFAPVQNALGTVTKFFRDITSGIRDYNTMQHLYETTKLENQSLRLQLATYEEEAYENVRLRALLDMKERYSTSDPVAANVIARNPGVWNDTFSINRGSVDGIAVDMAVITADGLVGRVMEVGWAYSKVMSIVDSTSAVGCLIERTRNQGSMRGNMTGNAQTPECNVYYLPSVNDIVPGDKVLTSGQDRIFPKGIPIGTVTAVSRQTDSSDHYVVVTPYVDFQTLEEVLVLRTVVETDTEALPMLPTPSPRPTPLLTPTPSPTVDPNAMPDFDENEPWERPTPMPDAVLSGQMPAPTETPVPQADDTPQPGEQPEDLWLDE